jgi:hypothetical protein
MKFPLRDLKSARGRLSLALAVLFSAAALTAPAVLAHAASTPAGALSKAPPPVVTGVIKYHGKLMAGVYVKLFAEPPSKILKKVKHGHNVPFKIIGGGRTSKKGRYSITVTGAGLKTARAYSFSSIHVVNLEVAAFYGKLGAVHWFARKLVLGALGDSILANAVMEGDTPQATAPEIANLSLQQPYIPATLAKDFIPAALAKDFVPAAGAKDLLPRAPACCQLPPSAFCFEHIAEPVVSGAPGMLGPQETVVGASYSNMADAKMGFVYGYGQNSSLGVAISISPPAGFKKWDKLGLDMSVGGTTTVSSTGSEPFTSSSGYSNREYLTGFTYQMYFEPCNGFSVQPTSFDGGTADRTVYGFPSDNRWCRYYNASPEAITKDTDNAYTFSAGVDISFWIDFDLSSQTGYDKNAELEYTFPHGGWLCGTTGYALGTAPNNLLYAGKYSHSPKKHRAKKAVA